MYMKMLEVNRLRVFGSLVKQKTKVGRLRLLGRARRGCVCCVKRADYCELEGEKFRIGLGDFLFIGGGALDKGIEMFGGGGYVGEMLAEETGDEYLDGFHIWMGFNFGWVLRRS